MKNELNVRDIMNRHDAGVKIAATCLNCGKELDISSEDELDCPRCGHSVMVYSVDAVEYINKLHDDIGYLIELLCDSI